jgi:predicted permease
MGELRIAFRKVFDNRAFALLAIVTLALGIGANAAIFSVVDAVVLKPLPYPDADRIVRVIGPFPQSFLTFGPEGPALHPDALEHTRAFTAIGLVASGGVNLGGTPAERLRAAAVTPSFFSVMRVNPVVGRTFNAQDSGDAAIAVISDTLWRRRFGSDRSILGRALDLDGRPFTVVGVIVRSAGFPESTDVWVPAGADGQILGVGPSPHVLARLAPGVTALQARDEVAALSLRPGSTQHADSIHVVPLADDLIGNVRPIAILVAAAAGLILLVACMNVANLLLTRVAARDREFAVRLALGATPGRIVRSLAFESFVLAALAGTTAIPAAAATLPVLAHMLPVDLHGVRNIGIDGRLLGVTVVLSAVTMLAISLLPALSLRRRSALEGLRYSVAATRSRVWGRFSNALVIAETAIAVLLLAGAFAIVTNVSRLAAVDVGAHRAGALTMTVTLPHSRYDSNEKVVGFFDAVASRVGALPGVQAIGAVNMLPGRPPEAIEGRTLGIEGLALPGNDRRGAALFSASPDYFSAVGIRLLAGRFFTEADGRDSHPVAIVSLGYIQTFGLTPAAAIGRRVSLSSGSGFGGTKPMPKWGEIVGVVDDVRLLGPEGQFAPALYEPFSVHPPRFSPLHIVIAADQDPASLLPQIREAVVAVDPDVPIADVERFGDIQNGFLASRRFAMELVGSFGLLALILTGVGLFGVIGYLVQFRTREIGIRIAVGATRAQIRRRVLLHGLGQSLAGSMAGLALTAAAAQIVAARLPHFWAISPSAYVVPCAFVIAVALAAAWLPASRAMRVDPLVALRAE